MPPQVWSEALWCVAPNRCQTAVYCSAVQIARTFHGFGTVQGDDLPSTTQSPHDNLLIGLPIQHGNSTHKRLQQRASTSDWDCLAQDACITVSQRFRSKHDAENTGPEVSIESLGPAD